MRFLFAFLVWLVVAGASMAAPPEAVKDLSGPEESVLLLDNGRVQVGIDREKGASITWLSYADWGKNIVNIHDPGRLIQQSYYAGHRLDRREEGQSEAWSPWAWNPIQGGGVGSWARVTRIERLGGETEMLFGETVPKLWDMPDEEALAVMRQWTGFEPGMPDVVVVRCEFVSQRAGDDRWGPAVLRSQEVPACYFTRNFRLFKSYLGEGRWREEEQEPGPPWGKARPPRGAMACFTSGGEGVAVFSPAGTEQWNFGPHGGESRSGATDGPCVHVAPIVRVKLGPKSTLRYRYWLVVGTEKQLAARLDALWEKYSGERVERVDP